MAVWPVSLPPPAINTMNESPADNLIRSNMDKGPAKVRRRTTANVRPLAFTLRLTAQELQTLENFYDVDTYSGAEVFDYIHPRTGAPVSARFAQRPSWGDTEGIVWNVSVSLEIMP